MLSDIEIAQSAHMKRITEIAANIGINEEDLEPYGHYKAKVSEDVYSKVADKENGKLILVTAIIQHLPVRVKQQSASDFPRLCEK